MRARLLVTAALAVLATGGPASAAAAAELEPLKDCYVSAGAAEDQRERIRLRGTGFTPMAPVDVSVDGTIVASGVADTVGDVIADVAAPFRETRARPFTVTVAERGNPANVVTLPTRVTALTFSLRPPEAPTWRRVRYRGSGFTIADRPIFAHYVYDGEERKRVRLAKRPRGKCGRFSVRRRQIPIRRPQTGAWTVQVDQRRRYREQPGTNVVRLPIHVRRVFREP